MLVIWHFSPVLDGVDANGGTEQGCEDDANESKKPLDIGERSAVIAGTRLTSKNS